VASDQWLVAGGWWLAMIRVDPQLVLLACHRTAKPVLTLMLGSGLLIDRPQRTEGWT